MFLSFISKINCTGENLDLFQKCVARYGHVVLAPMISFSSAQEKTEAFDLHEEFLEFGQQESPDKIFYAQVCTFQHGFFDACWGLTQSDFFKLGRSTGKDFSLGTGYLPPEYDCEIADETKVVEIVTAVLVGIVGWEILKFGSKQVYNRCCSKKSLQSVSPQREKFIEFQVVSSGMGQEKE